MKQTFFVICLLAFITCLFADGRQYTLSWDATSGLKSNALDLPSTYVAKAIYVPDNVNADTLKFELYANSGYRVLIGAAAGAVYVQKNDTTNATVVRLDPDIFNQFAGHAIKVIVTAADSAGIAANGMVLVAGKPE